MSCSLCAWSRASALANFGKSISQILTVPEIRSQALNALDFGLDIIPFARGLWPRVHPRGNPHDAAVRPVIRAIGGQAFLGGERGITSAGLVVLFRREESIGVKNAGSGLRLFRDRLLACAGSAARSGAGSGLGMTGGSDRTDDSLVAMAEVAGLAVEIFGLAGACCSMGGFAGSAGSGSGVRGNSGGLRTRAGGSGRHARPKYREVVAVVGRFACSTGCLGLAGQHFVRLPEHSEDLSSFFRSRIE